MKNVNVLVLLVVTTLSLPALTVDEILDRYSDTLGVPSIQGSFNVDLISRNGDVREIEARAYQKMMGDNQINRLFVFDFPPTVRGTALLLHSYFEDDRENNMWIYLPAIRRVKRVALEDSGGGFFMGSDFTYRDLINNDNSELEFQKLPDETVNGQRSYVIRAQGRTPAVQQEYGYSYIVSYYRQDNFLMHRREYYDFNGDLLKILEVQDFLDLDPWIYPTRLSMTNVQNDHQSIIEVRDASTDEIPDRMFTTRYLRSN